MNRDIKFKCWDKFEKKFIDMKNKYIGPQTEIVDCSMYAYGHHGAGDVILLQYIGKNDVNGKEIYEGDIVSKEGAFILWDNDLGCWCFNFKDSNSQNIPLFYDDNIEKYEVMGNIYETDVLHLS